MRYSKQELMKLIQQTVYEVTKIQVKQMDTNLLDTRLLIHPADFLYIFDILEKKSNVPAADILKNHDYTVMRVDVMSEALLELLQ